MRGKQLMPTVAELRDYVAELKTKADQGDMEAMRILLDLNRHKITLHEPDAFQTR